MSSTFQVNILIGIVAISSLAFLAVHTDHCVYSSKWDFLASKLAGIWACYSARQQNMTNFFRGLFLLE
jgi:hypothetical protein